jgi:hypothetical protein
LSKSTQPEIVQASFPYSREGASYSKRRSLLRKKKKKENPPAGRVGII